MRIDLHIHTQKCKQGDGSKRNITPEKFIEKMNKNNVKICAITNHNKFDFEEFKKIRELEPELTIFPGIELDINFKNNERKHIILICNPDSAEKFYNIFDNDCNRNYDEFFLNYNELLDKIERFSEDEIIIIPHFGDKDKKTALKKEDKEKLEKDLSKYIIILEPKLRTMGIINAHNEIALVGSDIKDWNNYIKDSLPEIKFKIDSFGKFYELAKDGSNFIKNFLEGAPKEKIIFEEENLEIEVYNDINVVFGEKGSGKTVLMKEIEKNLKKLNKKVFLHEGKDYGKIYQEMKEKYETEITIDPIKKENIKKLFSNIISYSEDKNINFLEEYKEYHNDNTTNKKSKNLKKANSVYSETFCDDIGEIIREFKERINCILKVEDINNILRKNKDERRKILNNELESLKNDIYEEVKEKYKNIFKIKNIEKVLETLKKSLKNKTGKKSKPTNIGLSKLISNRYGRINNNYQILKELKTIEKQQMKKLGNLPNKGEIILKTSVVVLKEETIHVNSPFEKNKIKLNKGIIKKLNKFSFEKLKEINKYFSSEEKEKNEKDFVDEIIKKENQVLKNDEKYEPSEGEKAILSITGLLENYDYDCYLFDEVERGLGHKYISEYLIPQLKKLRDKGKMLILSTHNANIAINTLPSQTIYCNYPDKNNYYIGQMYSNELIGIKDKKIENWENKALIHLEGSEKMFNQRRNIYGI